MILENTFSERQESTEQFEKALIEKSEDQLYENLSVANYHFERKNLSL